jgi:hypothetical protein
LEIQTLKKLDQKRRKSKILFAYGWCFHQPQLSLDLAKRSRDFL